MLIFNSCGFDFLPSSIVIAQAISICFYQHITKFSMLKSRTNWRSLVFCLSLAILAVTAIAQRFLPLFLLSLSFAYLLSFTCQFASVQDYRFSVEIRTYQNSQTTVVIPKRYSASWEYLNWCVFSCSFFLTWLFQTLV